MITPTLYFENDSINEDNLIVNISNINVSFVNSLRRIILSEIPILVFKSFPHADSKVDIISNSSRFTNEIIKQRLSCIPIHMSDKTINFNNYNDYFLEIKSSNETQSIKYITTEDFVIKKKEDNLPESGDFIHSVFPPNFLTKRYIDFLRLRPAIGDDIPCDKLHLLAEFSISNAKTDGMFNVVSKCSYGFQVDETKQNEIINIKQQQWKNEGLDEDAIEFETKNWFLLDGKRVTKANHFVLYLESIGIYNNVDLIKIGCQIISEKLDKFNSLILSHNVEITPATSTMKNAFDIILIDEDYTIGKIIEFAFYSKYYESNIATFCGFQKKHPHDTFSILRVAYPDPVDLSIISGHLQECITECKNIYASIYEQCG